MFGKYSRPFNSKEFELQAKVWTTKLLQQFNGRSVTTAPPVKIGIYKILRTESSCPRCCPKELPGIQIKIRHNIKTRYWHRWNSLLLLQWNCSLQCSTLLLRPVRSGLHSPWRRSSFDNMVEPVVNLSQGTAPQSKCIFQFWIIFKHSVQWCII